MANIVRVTTRLNEILSKLEYVEGALTVAQCETIYQKLGEIDFIIRGDKRTGVRRGAYNHKCKGGV